jgi:hypothetical protein
MSDADLGNAVHYHLARLGSRLTGTSGTVRNIHGRRDYIDSCMTSDRPGRRQAYGMAVLTGWAALLFAGMIGTLMFGYLADSAGGESARRVVVGMGAAGMMFCAGGMFNAAWRFMWFPWRAKRLAQRNGTADERYLRAMRGILPRNSSLVGQSIAAVLVLVLILA